MHPFLKSGKHIVIAGLLWGPVAFWVMVLHKTLVGSDWRQAIVIVGPPMLILLFFCLALWYVCKAVKLDKLRFIEVLIKHLLSLAVMNSLWLLFALGYSKVLDLLLQKKGWVELFGVSVPLFLGVGISMYFLAVLVYYLVLADEKAREAEREALQQQLAASRAELDALRSTIHPHFLFNNLNLLGPLIGNSLQGARELISRISEFLLYSLRYGSRPRVTVQDELDHVENYLGIEKYRLGKRLEKDFDVDDEALGLPILPLTLLPLVENAVKHGISQCLEGGTLSLSIHKGERYFYITVKNPYEEPARPLRGVSHGQKNLKKRLEVYYGPAAKMTVDRGESIFTVNLSIPINID